MSIPRLAVLAFVGLAVAACSPPPPPPPPPPQPKAEPALPPLTGAQIETAGDIEFDVAAATIRDTKTSREVLAAVAKVIQDTPRFTKVRVEGHTDADGTEATNQKLSEDRAAAVVKWLGEHGVAAGRLHSVGCAARDPLAPNTSAENKQKNRRTEFDVEEIDGKPAPGVTAACAPNPSRKH
jgi:OOP family OmpA-OmpF porin